jgi:hypothetical protein
MRQHALLAFTCLLLAGTGVSAKEAKELGGPDVAWLLWAWGGPV